MFSGSVVPMRHFFLTVQESGPSYTDGLYHSPRYLSNIYTITIMAN